MHSLGQQTTASFLNGRKFVTEFDDNTPWLITLADLFAILLICCLVLLSLNSQTLKTMLSSLQSAKETRATRLVSLAEANNGRAPSDITLSLPLYQLEDSKSRMKHNEEKIIIKTSVPLTQFHGPLNEEKKADLQRIGTLYKSDGTTRIVIGIRLQDESSSHVVQLAKVIMSYLVEVCGVERSNIYLQSLQTASPELPKNVCDSIEVMLLKEFWTF
ncbi:MAG: hypothetical protein N3B18_10535 [Desulfobacterota bacterium]|nr:hypothetical protein [Thermodesulfobacteriota bacterium]